MLRFTLRSYKPFKELDGLSCTVGFASVRLQPASIAVKHDENILIRIPTLIVLIKNFVIPCDRVRPFLRAGQGIGSAIRL